MSVSEDAVRLLVENMKERLERIQTQLPEDAEQQAGWLKSCQTTMNSCMTKLEELLPSADGQPLDVNRLMKVSRSCGLNFDQDNASGTVTSCCISCDSFYLEVELTDKGTVGKVKMRCGAHGAEPRASTLIQKLLESGRYALLCRHLRGLVAIYDLPGPKEDRAAMYKALCTVEEDIEAISQAAIVEKATLPQSIMETPLGIVRRRECGILTHMTFYATPEELMTQETKTDTDVVGKMGVNGHIGIATTLGNHSLPCKPLHRKDEASSTVTFAPLSEVTTANVPCTYILHLSESVAAPSAVAESILQLTDMKDSVLTPSGELHSILYHNVNPSLASRNKSKAHLYRQDVALPDGILSCFVRPCGDGDEQVAGAKGAVKLQDINFTHPEHLIKIVQILRRQLVYNTLILSCFASSPVFSHFDCVHIVDIKGDGTSSLQVTMEHPVSKNLACVTLDIAPGGAITGKLELAKEDDGVVRCSDDIVSKVAMSCCSVPVLVYSLRKRCSA